MPPPRGNDISVGKIAGSERSLLFSREDRDKHLYVVGTTGTGKSKFLEHLIRQDIHAWFKSHAGMLVLDPHGSLYDSLMGWLAKENISSLPIIPIDLRQDDWVVSYNALRKRDVPHYSVIISNFVQAMAHVWKESGTTNTPRFARWASNVLRTLYENDLTLLEADYLLDHLDREARLALTRDLENEPLKRAWRAANELKPRDFETELGSTVNRLHPFLQNPYMRNMFGHSRVSLDLRKSLDEGHIILVSLAPAGARVSEEDASLFGSLLLSDLWTAAVERGKDECVKPFYLYLDEFQRFVTPTIAKNLDQARGFDLHVTMAHQFPQQLLDQGEQGTQLYHSVMENASSKTVFRLQTEDNLRPLAQWLFRGVMNPDEIKHKLEATKVMGYEEVEGISRTTGRTETASKTEGYSQSKMTTEGSSETDNEAHSENYREDEYGWLIEEPHAHSSSKGKASGRSDSRSVGSQESGSTSESEAVTESETVNQVLIPVLGKEVSQVQFRSLEEQLHKAMAVLFGQEQKCGVVRLVGMKAPVSIETPTIKKSVITRERLKEYVAKLLEKWDFALPSAQAHAELADRTKALEKRLRRPYESEEPTTSRRRYSPRFDIVAIPQDGSNRRGKFLCFSTSVATIHGPREPARGRASLLLLFLDEFQNFTTDRHCQHAAEARKSRVCLILSHQ